MLRLDRPHRQVNASRIQHLTVSRTFQPVAAPSLNGSTFVVTVRPDAPGHRGRVKLAQSSGPRPVINTVRQSGLGTIRLLRLRAQQNSFSDRFLGVLEEPGRVAQDLRMNLARSECGHPELAYLCVAVRIFSFRYENAAYKISFRVVFYQPQRVTTTRGYIVVPR